MKILGGALAAVCCIIGFADLVGMAAAWFLCPGRCCPCLTLLPMGPGVRDAELRLRWAGHLLQWNRRSRGGQLVVVDLGADPETLAVCRAYGERRDWVTLCTPGELEELLAGPGVYKTFPGVLY